MCLCPEVSKRAAKSFKNQDAFVAQPFCFLLFCHSTFPKGFFLEGRGLYGFSVSVQANPKLVFEEGFFVTYCESHCVCTVICEGLVP